MLICCLSRSRISLSKTNDSLSSCSVSFLRRLRSRSLRLSPSSNSPGARSCFNLYQLLSFFLSFSFCPFAPRLSRALSRSPAASLSYHGVPLQNPCRLHCPAPVSLSPPTLTPGASSPSPVPFLALFPSLSFFLAHSPLRTPTYSATAVCLPLSLLLSPILTHSLFLSVSLFFFHLLFLVVALALFPVLSRRAHSLGVVCSYSPLPLPEILPASPLQKLCDLILQEKFKYY